MKFHESVQEGKRKTLREELFSIHGQELTSVIAQFYENVSQGSDPIAKIDIIGCTYTDNAEKRPELMSELLLVDGIFELKNSFSLIAYLSKHAEWKK